MLATFDPVLEFDARQSQIVSTLKQIRRTHGLAERAFSDEPRKRRTRADRRIHERIAFEVPIIMHPVILKDENTLLELPNEAIAGLTRDISKYGFGFSCDLSPNFDHMLVEFDLFGVGTRHLVVDVRWHRKKEARSYVGGGLVIGILKEDRSAF